MLSQPSRLELRNETAHQDKLAMAEGGQLHEFRKERIPHFNRQRREQAQGGATLRWIIKSFRSLTHAVAAILQESLAGPQILDLCLTKPHPNRCKKIHSHLPAQS